MKPPASIVIPLLRQVDDWLEQSVLSALKQTIECEVIVVVSPRTPGSNRSILDRLRKKHANLVVIEREPQMRFAAALNLGVRSASAARVGFLLSDDWLEAVAVETCLRRDADIVSTGRRFVSAEGVPAFEEIARPCSQAIYDRLKTPAERAKFLGHFFLFRRQALMDAGGVDECLGDSPGVDDFDMIWCMLDRGASVSIVEERLCNMREHPGERLTNRNREEMVATFNRILEKHHVTGKARERLMREHSLWFGESIWSVYQRIADPLLPLPAFLKPLRLLYRAAVPLHTRIAIHDRWNRKQ
jgi:glycosyltransferase involved in cell wall biosynthesis